MIKKILRIVFVVVCLTTTKKLENELPQPYYVIKKEVVEEIKNDVFDSEPIHIEVQNLTREKMYINELKNMQSTNDMEWFVEYKSIMKEYSDVIDMPETIYDCYSEEDIYLICRAVETEVYDAGFIPKCNVASVIFNRIESGKYGDSVGEVVTSPNQFAYGRRNITKDTILAVEYVFMIEDTTDGCIAFRSDKKINNWGQWSYSFTDSVGHHFYK